MTYLDIFVALEHWTSAFGILLGTFVVIKITRAILTNLHNAKNWHLLNELATSISNILYIVGLKLFAEFAPLPPRVDAWFDHAVYILSILIFLNLAQRAALISIEWSTKRTDKSDMLQQGFLPLIRNIITLFIFFSGGIMILKHFNYDVMSLITALGVSSLAVGLAAKDTLSHMISGFTLIIDRNLSPGDRINLNGTIGDVGEIGLRSTKIRVVDGNTLIVPNSDLVNTKILNLSIPSRAVACSTSIRVPFGIPFSRIQETCFKILEAMKHSRHISNDQSTSVTLAQISDGYQLVEISFWVNDLNDSKIAISEFNQFVLVRFQEEHIPLVAGETASPT